jgi:hypothetical protein
MSPASARTMRGGRVRRTESTRTTKRQLDYASHSAAAYGIVVGQELTNDMNAYLAAGESSALLYLDLP